MNIFKKILRVLLSILWRLALLAVVCGAVIAVGLGMLLNTILTGPSETARNTLTATLLEYETTRAIPAYFLDQATIDAICTAGDTLPADASDPALIKLDATILPGSETQTLQAENYTAEITLIADPSQADFSAEEGENFVGFSDGGVLIVATSAEEAETFGISGRCEKILMMNGQVNTGLYAANSGLTARSAIGQRADGTVILVTIHGGRQDLPGGTWQDLIDIMTEYGAVNACSLTVSADASEE